MASAAQAVPESIFLRLEIGKDNSVSVKNLEFSYEPPSEFLQKGQYEFRVVSDKILFRGSYDIAFMAFGETYSDFEQIEIEKQTVSLKFPYYPDAAKIEIYKAGSLIHEIDLYPIFCNEDSVCDVFETANCQDCKLESPAPVVQKDSKPNYIPFLIVIGTLFVVLLGLAVYSMRRK